MLILNRRCDQVVVVIREKAPTSWHNTSSSSAAHTATRTARLSPAVSSDFPRSPSAALRPAHEQVSVTLSPQPGCDNRRKQEVKCSCQNSEPPTLLLSSGKMSKPRGAGLHPRLPGLLTITHALHPPQIKVLIKFLSLSVACFLFSWTLAEEIIVELDCSAVWWSGWSRGQWGSEASEAKCELEGEESPDRYGGMSHWCPEPTHTHTNPAPAESELVSSLGCL